MAGQERGAVQEGLVRWCRTREMDGDREVGTTNYRNKEDEKVGGDIESNRAESTMYVLGSVHE